MIDILFIGSNELYDTITRFTKGNSQINFYFYSNLVSAVKKLSPSKPYILVIDLEHEHIEDSYPLSIMRRLNGNLHSIALTSDDSLENIRALKEKEINDIAFMPLKKNRINEILNKAMLSVS